MVDVTTTIIALMVVFTTWTLSGAYLTPLRKIPGPFAAKFSRLWIAINVARGHAHYFYQDLHRKYGPIVRIGPNKIIFNDPEATKLLFGVGSKFNKSTYYTAFGMEMSHAPLPAVPNPSRLNLFSTTDLDYHKHVKSAIAPAYTIASLKHMEPFVDTCSDIFIKQMKQRTDQVVDLGAWLQWYAFDVVGMITFHKRFSFLEEAGDVLGIVERLFGGVVYSSVVGQIPWLHGYLLGNNTFSGLLTTYTPFGKHSPIVPIRKLIYNSMQEYSLDRKTTEPRGDYLDYLYRMQDKNARLSQQEVVDSLFVNIFAGSDTTAITLRAIFYFLVKYPRVYAKLQAEIDAFDSAGKFGETVPFDIGNEMPYLKASIKESMRLHPGVPMPLERTVPAGGAKCCGYSLPEGTDVGVAPSAINCRREAFGDDADAFRPERWIDSSEEQLSIMEKNFISFGMGARLCIGKNIALLEMTKLVPQFLRHFDLEWAGEESGWQISGYWFAKQDDVLMRIKDRKL